MPHTFQSIIIKLQEFWASRGCLIWQPYYTQVGAGTMNPATFLRVLGPEPWNVAYVEPSVRPDDGRYGENPNRLQMHYQYQVILKPDPGNPQEIYLDSLKALGIDPRQHDIRFVEDNWEQPAISAWGLGWEVWLDGQEITQFTYFQQVGGVMLDPVAVEITYGLDRILIALNNASGIWNEPWNEQITYGEIRRREEYEHSKYYYEIADVARARQMYELYLAECEACLAAGLVLPAHDYVLKSSHAFNVLDARGAVSLTERQASFGKMRELARRVALTYLEQRKELGFPLLKETPTPALQPVAPQSTVNHPSSFLLEIGTEELPAGDVDAALAQLRERVPAWLQELRLEHGAVSVHATPRRLTVFVENLAPAQADREELVKGPPAEKAFDPTGNPTPAALGFARKNGLEVADLQVRDMDGGKYVVAVVKSKGRPALEILAESLPGWVAGIAFVKTMRWNQSGVAFSRPIRWFVALLGEQVIPFAYAGISSGRVSRGLRPCDSPEIVISSAETYFQAIRQAGILLDLEERKAAIVEQVNAAAQSVGGQALIEPGLLAEVANLIEKPTAVLGAFDAEFLALPRDVLIGTMKKHQRYFPVLRAPASQVSGAAQELQHQGAGTPTDLLPFFIAIRNGDAEFLDLVRQGNEHVLGARFADANFFVREDVKFPLEHYREGLKKLVFQTRLGSMFEKSERIVRLAEKIGLLLGLEEAQRATVYRAAFLAKADLTTQMVTEMTSLQGIIGREYALRAGEPVEVAEAIGEQYQPVPRTLPGVVVALADRIDSLVGLFAAGLAPSGTKDPFGLRRAAIGTVEPLIQHQLDFDLRQAVEAAAALQPIAVSEDVKAQVLEFLTGRMRVLLIEAGFRYDVVDAVLAAQSHNPAACASAARALTEWVNRADWMPILEGYARCARIVRSAPDALKNLQSPVERERLVEEAERKLYDALQAVASRPPSSVHAFLGAIQALLPFITEFFDKVLVMDPDEAIRRNRLMLVARIRDLAQGIADLSKLEGF